MGTSLPILRICCTVRVRPTGRNSEDGHFVRDREWPEDQLPVEQEVTIWGDEFNVGSMGAAALACRVRNAMKQNQYPFQSLNNGLC